MGLPWSRAIVVGASSGIGEEIARQLAADGCRVAIVARRSVELERIAKEIDGAVFAGAEPKALPYTHDVLDTASVPALFQQIAQDLGGLDLVVYSSGVMPPIAEGEYNFSKDESMIDVNVLGAVAWLNEAAQRFERAGAGTIVGISSVAGERGRRGMPVYGATKAFLTTYLEALRNRLSRYGVTVVTIKPGPIKTPMVDGVDKLPLLIPADKAAAQIIAAAKRGRGTAFVPGLWQPIMLVVRSIPSFIFRKLNF